MKLPWLRVAFHYHRAERHIDWLVAALANPPDIRSHGAIASNAHSRRHTGAADTLVENGATRQRVGVAVQTRAAGLIVATLPSGELRRRGGDTQPYAAPEGAGARLVPSARTGGAMKARAAHTDRTQIRVRMVYPQQYADIIV
jgi:hypothetical protein